MWLNQTTMIRHPRLVRLFSTSHLLRSADGTAHQIPNLGNNLAQRKPLGAIRGGFVFITSSASPTDPTEAMFARSIIGFLLGFSLASTYAAYRLVDEYKQASAILQASVEELQATAVKASGFPIPITPISEQAGFDPPEAN
jgi:hypothetical protein